MPRRGFHSGNRVYVLACFLRVITQFSDHAAGLQQGQIRTIWSETSSYPAR
jgi:hypothetical protein